MDRPSSPAEEIVYEVECLLDPDVVAEFDAWLPGHVRDVMRSPGFLHAETLRPAEPAADGKVRRVNRYRVQDRAALDHYLEQLAPALREDGAKRFGGRATYVRRVLVAAATFLPDAGVDGTCANCGTRLYGHYCAECGQLARESARSLGTLFHDAWHVLTHIDGRFWQTLRRLAFSPGYLTNEYFAERRARYIPPFRLYIVISLIFFGLASLSSVFERTAPIEVDAASGKTTAELNRDAAEIAAAKRKLAEKGAPGAVAGLALGRAAEEVQAELRAAQAREGAAAPATPEAKPVAGTYFDTAACSRTRIQPAWLERLIGPGMQAACERAAKDGGRTLAHAVGANIPKMMFVFLPLMAAVMMLLYWFPRRYYVEHLVFYLHAHAALFLLITAVIVLGMLGNLIPPLEAVIGLLGFAVFLYAIWYMWRAMRVHYRNGRMLTFVKAWVIFIAYVTCLSLTLVGTAIVSALNA